MPSVSPPGIKTAARIPRRIAVLGGAGHIGRMLCTLFAERGDDVVAFVRTADPRLTPSSVRVVSMDLVDAGAAELARALERENVDVVVNAIGGAWTVSEEGMFRANVTVVECILEAFARLERRPRLIHLGSIHEYGLAPLGVSIEESAQAKPLSAYGETKLRGTDLVLAACERGDLEAVVLRISNTVGLGQQVTSLLGAVALRLVDARHKEEPARLEFASLRAARDFVDMRDAINAIVVAADSDVSGHVFNIGRGEAVSARVVVDLLVEASGVSATVIEGPAAAPETQWQQMNVASAARLLGWKPTYDLAAAVESLWIAYTAAERVGPASGQTING